MKQKQIVFTGINKAELLDVTCTEPGKNEVVVKTMSSTISCGTERSNIAGDVNTNIYEEPKDEKPVFPRMSGYSSAGIVTKIGENVKSVTVGDRVAVYWGHHKQYNVVNENNVVKIAYDNVSFSEASMSFISTFSLAAIRKTRLETGESCIVFGQGILGQFSVVLARAAGAVPVIAVDPVKERRERAIELGADYALDPTEEDFIRKVMDITGGGANVAIEVTGLGKGLEQALDCMARFGRVSLLGCTRDRNFTIDYYRKVHGKGVTIVGAHTMARPEYESSSSMFTHRDDIKTVLKLIAMKRIDFKSMICETHSPSECEEVYTRLVSDRAFPPIVQFDWTKLD